MNVTMVRILYTGIISIPNLLVSTHIQHKALARSVLSLSPFNYVLLLCTVHEFPFTSTLTENLYLEAPSWKWNLPQEPVVSVWGRRREIQGLLSASLPHGKAISWEQDTLFWRGAVSFLRHDKSGWPWLPHSGLLLKGEAFSPELQPLLYCGTSTAHEERIWEIAYRFQLQVSDIFLRHWFTTHFACTTVSNLYVDMVKGR